MCGDDDKPARSRKISEYFGRGNASIACPPATSSSANVPTPAPCISPYHVLRVGSFVGFVISFAFTELSIPHIIICNNHTTCSILVAVFDVYMFGLFLCCVWLLINRRHQHINGSPKSVDTDGFASSRVRRCQWIYGCHSERRLFLSCWERYSVRWTSLWGR